MKMRKTEDNNNNKVVKGTENMNKQKTIVYVRERRI